MNEMSVEAHLPERLARAITMGGPIPVAQFMGAANAHYYGTRDPLGAQGDFTTAPEISQMFGELIGLWLADIWMRADKPPVHFVELGPGRGTLASDALRSMRSVGLTPPVHFVETSPTLREAQKRAVPDAVWHDEITTLPTDAPLLLVANEFFDALPIYQLVKDGEGWRERVVACQDTLFLPIAGRQLPDDIVPERLRDAAQGSIIETSPAAVAHARAVAERVANQGGIGLIVDYGYDGPQLGDTLQAIRQHAFRNPFDTPGEQDLTAHVDFATLAAMAEMAGARVHGPVPQGLWLESLGIVARTDWLKQTNPDKADDIEAARSRLTHPAQMGTLFRAMAFSSREWPEPEGFGLG